MRERREVADLGDQPDRGQGVDAAHAPQPPDQRRPLRLSALLVNQSVETITARHQHLMAGQVLTEHHLRQRVLKPQLAQPGRVTLGLPRAAGTGVAVAVAQQHLADPVPGGHQIATQVLTSADQIPQRLKIGRRDGDRTQLAGGKLAAGGVADGRVLAAVLALGADAAWVGTRFLLAEEASVHNEWRPGIQDAQETGTVYSMLFDRGWPDAPHRTLRNSTVRTWEQAGRPAAPWRPGEGDAVACAPDGSRLYRYGSEPAVPGATGAVEALALYAGQSAGLINDLLPATAIVDELVSGAARALERAARPVGLGGRAKVA